MIAHLGEDLELLARTIADAADTRGLRVWPAALGDGGGWPLATLWPSRDDPHGFIEVAVEIGANLLYFDQLHAKDLDSDTGDSSVDEGVVQVTAAFVSDGVVHHLTVVSREWSAEREVQDFRTELDLAEDEARIDRFARDVVNDDAFQDHGGAGRDIRKHAAVRAKHPDLDSSTAWRVVRVADRIGVTEHKPAREAAIAVEAHRMVADGSTKVAAATNFEIAVSVLSRIMQQNPPAAAG